MSTNDGRRDPQPGLTLADLRRDPRLYGILLAHALRGMRIQLLLRGTLVAFVAGTVIAVAPAANRTACDVTAALYAVWAAVIVLLTLRGGERTARLSWLALFVDLLALGILSVLAGASEQSWTADVLVNGFFLVPVLASTQLRPRVAAAVCAPAVGVYLASVIAAQNANGEPTASIALRTGTLAAVGLGCVLLSWTQRSRVLTIAELMGDRTHLLAELVDVESRARSELAEELHDGALQYVLAATQELPDARAGDAASYERIAFALRESTALLRAKVRQLHPAVLKQAGLLQALEDLVAAATERGELHIELLADGWDPSARSANDDLLYGAAREFLTNVTKHANARTVQIRLTRDEGRLRLTVVDDGTGIDERVLAQRLAEGHVGVASQRVRVQAAGGRFTLRPGQSGTVAEVELPATAPAPNLSAAAS